MEITWAQVLIVLNLVILEGLLSFDNALALAALVRKKLKDAEQRKKALLWGIWGAYFFRIGMIFIGVWLMKFEWVKAIAGLYLVYLAVHELFFHKKNVSMHETELPDISPESLKVGTKIFFMTVLQVELMDIMFSIDSIAVALALSDNKWILISGAVIGVLMMRIAAQYFIKLIEAFPILEKTAFVLVGYAGLNVLLKLKDLNLGFAKLTIDKEIPEGIFLVSMLVILVGAMLINKIFPEKFRHI